MKKEKNCYFCDIEKINEEKRIIKEEKSWYGFVPQQPEIFGHCIVTTKEHYDDILSKDGKEALDIMTAGVKIIADKIKNIDNMRIEKVYFAMLGETEKTHMHYHLFPRYGFVNDFEINEWAKKNRLNKGSIEWKKFYANPTYGFKSFDGFQYLGEIERTYHETEKRIGFKPSEDLVKDIAKILSK